MTSPRKKRAGPAPTEPNPNNKPHDLSVPQPDETVAQMTALVTVLRAHRMAALVEALRPRDTVLQVAMLRAGCAIRIGWMLFAGEFTPEEFTDLNAAVPHHHLHWVAAGLYSQEVTR
jgi:hypothetical protein